MSFWFIGKSIAIASGAALVAWVYALFYASFWFGSWEGTEFPLTAFMACLLGSFAIGLPVALLTFWLSHDHLIGRPLTLGMIAVLAGVMMMLASFVLASNNGLLEWGVPAFLAAITYGVLGWFWILKPLGTAKT